VSDAGSLRTLHAKTGLEMRHRIALWTVNRVVTKDHWRRSKLRSPRTSSTWRCTETEFVIAKHGERVKWRHRRDVVLFHGRYVYWREQGVINRTFRLSYMKGGRPDEKVLAKIRKRFWPNTADRQYYWWIARNFD